MDLQLKRFLFLVYHNHYNERIIHNDQYDFNDHDQVGGQLGDLGGKLGGKAPGGKKFW